mgnify:CR=1 FL=1
MSKNTIKIMGKTSDRCNIEVDGVNYDGYVPQFATDKNYGSYYISLEIDITTGQILDWDRRKKQLDEFLEKRREEEKKEENL